MEHPGNKHHAKAEAMLRRAGYGPPPAASTQRPQRPSFDTELPKIREQNMEFAGGAQHYEGPVDRGTPQIKGGRLSRDNPDEKPMAFRTRGTYRDSEEMIERGSEDGSSEFLQGSQR